MNKDINNKKAELINELKKDKIFLKLSEFLIISGPILSIILLATTKSIFKIEWPHTIFSILFGLCMSTFGIYENVNIKKICKNLIKEIKSIQEENEDIKEEKIVFKKKNDLDIKLGLKNTKEKEGEKSMNNEEVLEPIYVNRKQNEERVQSNNIVTIYDRSTIRPISGHEIEKEDSKEKTKPINKPFVADINVLSQDEEVLEPIVLTRKLR